MRPEPIVLPPTRIVAPRRRIEPAFVVVAIIVALVGLATWKPWGGGHPAVNALPTKRPTDRSVVADSFGPSPPADHPVLVGAMVAQHPAGTLPVVDGLDLREMGASDLHTAWGVAVAYTPTTAIEAAVWSGVSAVTPVVDWQAINPATTTSRRAPVPTLDHSGSTTIAVAVTWPADVVVAGVSLRWASSARGGATSRAMPLVVPLPLLVRLVPSGLSHFNPTTVVAWQLLSGSFFLAPYDPPSTVAGWARDRWPIGRYVFTVRLSDGTNRSLAFDLGG